MHTSYLGKMNSLYFLIPLCISWKLVSSLNSWDLLPPPPPNLGDPVEFYNATDVCSGALQKNIVMTNALKCDRSYSCQRRCGAVASQGEDCSCDEVCKTYGDCCYDYDSICQSNSRVIRIMPVISAVPICVETSQDEFVLFLGEGCLPHWQGTDMEAKCLSHSTTLSNKIPVTDVTNQLHYTNIFCAKCNDVTDYRFWNASYECSKELEVLKNITDPLEILKQRSCYFKLHFPPDVTKRHCQAGGTENRCPPNNTCTTQIQEACKKYKNVVDVQGKEYQNEYCAICHGKNVTDMTCPAKILFPFIPPIHSVVSGSTDVEISGSNNRPSLGSFSFSIVMDFTQDAEVQVGVGSGRDDDVTMCTLDEVTSSCIPSQCRKDYILKDGACVLGVLVYDVHVNTLWEPKATSDPLSIFITDDFQLKNYGQILTNLIGEMYGEAVYGFVTFGAARKQKESFLIHNDFKLQFNKTVEADEIKEEWINVTRTERFRSVLGQFVTLVNSTISLSLYHDPYELGDMMNVTNTSDQVLHIAETDCERVRFDSYDTTENGNIILLPSMTIVNESDVLYDNNGSILVCRNLLNFTVGSNSQDNLRGDDSKEALGILTIVCIAISLVCLLIRIALQPFVALFQTFPGKLQLSLCLSLVLWKVFFLARPFASLSGDVSACIAVAALFHWSLLASFFWMNVIAIDLWKTFRRTSSLQISAESNKTIFGYVCYATLLPGGIVALCLVLDYVDIDSQFQPHYSGPACYISNIYPLVLFLVAPIGVILIVNIVLFAMIARSIHIAISEAGKLKAKRNKHTFLIYVRLFALMGTTWLFGFLSGGLGVIALNFIFVILTTLDGLFIFIAVVCSRRVWRDLRDRKIITRSSTRTLTLSSSNKLPPTPKSPTPSESNSLKFSLKQDTSLSRL